MLLIIITITHLAEITFYNSPFLPHSFIITSPSHSQITVKEYENNLNYHMSKMWLQEKRIYESLFLYFFPVGGYVKQINFQKFISKKLKEKNIIKIS